MTIAAELYEKAFPSARDARSEAYKAGVLDTLNFKESGTELNHPFKPGTAESDAWFAGNLEGHTLWRDYQEADSPSNQEGGDFNELLQLQRATKGASRKEAAVLNPLIDDMTSCETLSRVRDMVFLLQDINAQGLDIECKESHRAIFHILCFTQGAIDFEMSNREGKSNGK